MATLSSTLGTVHFIFASTDQNVGLCRAFPGVDLKDQGQYHRNFNNRRSQSRKPRRFTVVAASEGSASSEKSEETIPSWARLDSIEPPPWARNEGKGNDLKQSFEIPYYGYLLASAVTAIAAIGSVFEYANQRPVFGVVNSDSIFYVPILGFFAITGIPTAAFLWFKAVRIANEEAEEQDRSDGFL